jgi:RmuC family
MESIKGPINGLSGKNYQSIYSLNSLDFVLLFVPIEPAFMLAVASDRDLSRVQMLRSGCKTIHLERRVGPAQRVSDHSRALLNPFCNLYIFSKPTIEWQFRRNLNHGIMESHVS